MNVLICGHIDITEEQFNEYYIPNINRLLELHPGATFYIGGVDTYTQDYIHKLGHKMVICDKGEQNNVMYPGESTTHINGFKTYIERDQYMVSQCDEMLLFLRNEPSSLGTGSIRNLISKSLGSNKAFHFMKHSRSREWDSIDECLEQFDIPDDITEKIRQILVI